MPNLEGKMSFAVSNYKYKFADPAKAMWDDIRDFLRILAINKRAVSIDTDCEGVVMISYDYGRNVEWGENYLEWLTVDEMESVEAMRRAAKEEDDDD